MKKILFLIVLISPIICNGQEYVKVKTSIPSNNANNAQGEKSAVWRNSVMAPSTSDNFPNNQNWWTILQAQFQDTRYDAQLAFGLNKQDLWLRFNYNDAWKPWKKIVLEDENGNVGIGTSAPNEKLDVRGNIYMNTGTNNNHIFWSGHHMTMGTKPGHYYHNIFSLKPGGASQGNLVSKFQMYTVSSNFQEALKVLVNTAGSSFFNGGNVGIGTTTPDHKLDVNGVIRAKEIKVETNWSDFVFEPGYNLRTLEDLEQYIAQNKHLPDIPSESEVKENGINLGEINAKLLQKIEELTLYVIEQNKEIKSLKKKIHNLQRQ